MTLIYYTNEEGKVTYHHKAPDAGPVELAEMVRSFNKSEDDNRRGRTAHIAELEENSLEEYLYRRAEERRLFPKRAIQDALDALSAAEDEIRSLDTEPEERR